MSQCRGNERWRRGSRSTPILSVRRAGVRLYLFSFLESEAGTRFSRLAAAQRDMPRRRIQVPCLGHIGSVETEITTTTPHSMVTRRRLFAIDATGIASA